jgi:hypothetical protein
MPMMAERVAIGVQRCRGVQQKGPLAQDFLKKWWTLAQRHTHLPLHLIIHFIILL